MNSSANSHLETVSRFARAVTTTMRSVVVPVAVASSVMLGCSSSPTGATEAAASELPMAYECTRTSAVSTDNFTGDGDPIVIWIEREPGSDDLYVSLLEQWDLDNDETGLPRSCAQDSITDETTQTRLYTCWNEAEWQFYDLTSTFHIDGDQLAAEHRAKSFELVYFAAEQDDAAEGGFIEHENSERHFACQAVPSADDGDEAAECCVVCTAGQACGNSCIAADATCDQPQGCACQR